MLKKTDFLYLYIMWVIWSIADYYKDLFRIEPEENPCQTKFYLIDRDGYQIIRLYFEKNFDEPRVRGLDEIKRIINSYLQHVLLPEQRILAPFAFGGTCYDICEPLYVIDVFENKDEMAFDVLYVDNISAFLIMQDELSKDKRRM